MWDTPNVTTLKDPNPLILLGVLFTLLLFVFKDENPPTLGIFLGQFI